MNISGQAREVAATQRSYGLAGVGSLELAHGLAVFAKLGVLRNEQETRRISPNPSTLTGSDTGVHYGLGARYAFAPNWAARAEWENTEKLKVELLSLGVEYRL